MKLEDWRKNLQIKQWIDLKTNTGEYLLATVVDISGSKANILCDGWGVKRSEVL